MGAGSKRNDGVRAKPTLTVVGAALPPEGRVDGGRGETRGPDGMAMLSELIRRLNPYTERTDPATGNTSGEMDICVGPARGDDVSSEIQLEIDAKYASDWTFKGAPHRINTAVRIKDRYSVTDRHGAPLYWVEDYLLLGYESAGGS